MNQLIAIKQHIVKNKKTIIRCFWILLLINTFPFFYIGKSIEGVVTDESGAPIEGVVALLEHVVETTNGHHIDNHTVYITEAITDHNGRYHFPWWVTWRRYILGWRDENSPYINFFKTGYKRGSIVNKSKLGTWPSVYVFLDMPSNVTLKTFRLKPVSDQGLNWYAPTRDAMGGECRRFFLPLYTKERDAFIKSINPIRERRGLSLLKGSEYESTYCN